MPSSPSFAAGLAVGAAGALAAAAAVAVLLGAQLPPPTAPATASAASGAPSPGGRAPAPPPLPPDDDDLFKREQTSRHRAFFGDAGEAAVERGFVVVVGVGGVGSHAAHMLARAGVARLRVIDFDNVSLSSLNRHATATRAEVGTPKVAALADAVRRVMPSVRVEAVQRIFDGAHAAELLLDADGASPPDVVLDCIDDVDTKAALLAFCTARGIRVVSSLGAGGKADPSRLCVGDLSDVRGEALGGAVRHTLRAGVGAQYGAHDLVAALGGPVKGSGGGGGGGESGSGGDATTPTAGGGAAARPQPSQQPSPQPSPQRSPSPPASGSPTRPTGITVIYSAEEPRAKLLPLALSAGESPSDFGALAGFRVRVLPVLGTMPALFGQAMAAVALCTLAGPSHEIVGLKCADPLPPGATAKIVRTFAALAPERHAGALQYELNLARGRIATAAGAADDADADATAAAELAALPPMRLVPSTEEFDFVLNEVWRTRSPVCRERVGTKGIAMQLVRWRPHAPSLPTNLVLMTDDEAVALHEATTAAVLGVLSAEAARARDGEAALRTQAALTAALDAASRAAAVCLFGADAVATIEARLAWAAHRGW